MGAKKNSSKMVSEIGGPNYQAQVQQEPFIIIEDEAEDPCIVEYLTSVEARNESENRDKPENESLPKIFLKSVPELPASSVIISEKKINECQSNNGYKIIQQPGLTKYPM